MKFLRQLMNWFDSWADWFNPITLRELRCEARKFGYELALIPYCFFVIIAAFILCIPELRQNLFYEIQLFLFSVIIALPISSCCSVFPSILKSRRIDELLDIVPLSPQQQVHGYWAHACIESIFFHSIFLPFVAIAQLVNPAYYVWLFVLLGSFFNSQIVALVCLSFLARAKQGWEWWVSALAIFCFYPGLIAIIGHYVIIFVLQHRQLFVRHCGFLLVSFFISLSAILLLHGYIAYKLSVYGFKTWRKPFWHSLLWNMTVYMLFHITEAAIWIAFAITAVYFCNILTIN
jgi:hypothetical protein